MYFFSIDRKAIFLQERKDKSIRNAVDNEPV